MEASINVVYNGGMAWNVLSSLPLIARSRSVLKYSSNMIAFARLVEQLWVITVSKALFWISDCKAAWTRLVTTI